MTKLDQFSGTAGQKRLATTLMKHELMGKNAAMAKAFAKQAIIEEFADGQTLLKQEGTDSHLYMILDGEVGIEVNGNRVATSGAGVPIGEMALVDPKGGRSASVVAIKPTVVARFSRPKFIALAKRYPQVWHAIARHLARHVRKHNLRFK
jgi:CRP/FNR family transcriptional regulator, cyclic AMP receptor protein